MLEGHQARYTGGPRRAERGLVPWLQPGVPPESRHDSRRGPMLAAWVAATLHRVWSPVALQALESSASARPWLPQEPTTMALSGASATRPGPPEEAAEEAQTPSGPGPAPGDSQDGRAALKPA